MTGEQFRSIVRAMRSAQTEYFRTKSHNALARSKEWERAVDRELDLDDARQLRLFEDGDTRFLREEREAIRKYGGG